MDFLRKQVLEPSLAKVWGLFYALFKCAKDSGHYRGDRDAPGADIDAARIVDDPQGLDQIVIIVKTLAVKLFKQKIKIYQLILKDTRTFTT